VVVKDPNLAQDDAAAAFVLSSTKKLQTKEIQLFSDTFSKAPLLDLR
jgi:hypothetical protein